MIRRLLAWLADRVIERSWRTPYFHLLHADGSLYMERFWLFRTRWVSARVHHICTPDFDPHLHDHPWSFVSLVLRGGYHESRPLDSEPSFYDDGSEAIYTVRRDAGSVAFRRATDRHLIYAVDPDTWTLFITGPKRQWWGFHTPAGKIHWRKYESLHVSEPAREAA